MVVKGFRLLVCRFKPVPRTTALSLWLLPLLLFAFACAQCAPAQAQANAASKLQGHPLFWADGITRTSDLNDYKDAGLNLVVVRLDWTPSRTGEFSAADLAPQRAFAEAAAKRGLLVVYSLPAAPTGFEASLRLSADSASYLALWTAWVDSAVSGLSTTPNLLGWMLPDDPRSLPIFDDLGFQHWIARNYATTEILNAQWNTKFTELGDVSIGDVDALNDQWHQDAPLVSMVSGADAQDQIEASKNPLNRRTAFHPAELALAAYKWDAYRELMTAWTEALRGADGGRHLIFSGQLPDYAQLLSQPEGVDVLVPHMTPNIVENDVVTHNPQSIDIARRGGKFGAWPLFSARESALIPQSALSDLVGRWLDTARARGAVGAGFDSWDGLKRNAPLRAAIGEKIALLSRGREMRLWGSPPACTTAILLTPLADGATVKAGTLPNQTLRGLYGFGEDMVVGEPSNLVWSLRWGTAFGGIDYLSPDDLTPGLENHYTTILAPQLLSCPQDTGTALANFVFNGGTLVSDLGLGALQSGGQANAIPPQMAQLFGVPGVYDLSRTAFNLTGALPHPLFRAWSDIIAGHDNASLTMGESMGSKAFSGPVAFSSALPVAQTLAVGPQIVQNFGGNKRVLRTSLTVNDAGRGYAIFAPFQLWVYWRSGNIGFDDFHGDLWARGAPLAESIGALVPAPALIPEGQTRFAEVDDRSDSITLTNLDAPGQNVKFSSLQTTGTGDWLWANTTVLLSNDSQSLLGSGRPAPIESPKEFEARPRPIVIYTALQSGESKVLQMVPIAVQNLSGGPLCAQVIKADSSEVEANIWPNASIVIANTDQWQPSVNIPATCRFTMQSSEVGYTMAPGSRHRVVVTDYAKQIKKGFQTTEQFVTADAKGRVTFDFSGAACRIRVTSAETPLTAADDSQLPIAGQAPPEPAPKQAPKSKPPAADKQPATTK